MVVDSAFRIHSTLGPGLFESVYEVTMAHELRQRGCHVACQRAIPVIYDDVRLERGFRADVIVDEKGDRGDKVGRGDSERACQTTPDIFAANGFSTGATHQLQRCSDKGRNSTRSQ
jgi:hypothetical protein